MSIEADGFGDFWGWYIDVPGVEETRLLMSDDCPVRYSLSKSMAFLSYNDRLLLVFIADSYFAACDYNL